MLAAQLCSLVILITVIISWIVPKKLYFDDTKPFVILMITTAINVVLDIVGTYTAVKDLPLKNILFKIYLASLVLRAFFEFLYLVIKSFKERKVVLPAKYMLALPIIGSIIVLIAPINIEASEYGLLVSGLSIDVAYITATITAVAMLVYLILFFNKFNRWNRLCFVTTLAMWGTAVGFQLIVEQTGILAIAFSCTLAAIFAFLENPLNYRNHEFNCFKNNFIFKYIDYLIESGKKGCIYMSNVISTNKTNEDVENYIKFKKDLINKLNKYKDLSIFLSVGDEVTIICDDNTKFDYYFKVIKQELLNHYNSLKYKQYYRSELIFCRDINLFNNATGFNVQRTYASEIVSGIPGHRVDYEINAERIEEMNNEERIKGEIESALAEDRVKAFVQPIYSVEKKKVISAEALVRLFGYKGSMLYPKDFIPVSEKCGLDIPIGYRMIEKVCQILSSSTYGKLFEFIDINLSIGQCEQENMASKIINIVQKFNVDPKRISFEITESGFINKMDAIRANIKLLTDYGFGFSLDDFGNGESNLDYLVRLPVKYLKLDMNMIWAYFKNENAKKTVLSIVKISHSMGLKVVAEGVETEEQFKEMERIGVDFVQGYYFYKPMSVADYDQLLKDKK